MNQPSPKWRQPIHQHFHHTRKRVAALFFGVAEAQKRGRMHRFTDDSILPQRDSERKLYVWKATPGRGGLQGESGAGGFTVLPPNLPR